MPENQKALSPDAYDAIEGAGLHCEGGHAARCGDGAVRRARYMICLQSH
jgi:hypothetical protein